MLSALPVGANGLFSPAAPDPDRAEVTPEAPAPGARPKFPKDDGFMAELRRRVDDYFRRTGLSERDSPRMYLKSAVILAWAAASYVLLVFFAPSLWLALPLAVSLAFAMAAIAFSIQHDGGHGAYSRRGWVNKLAAMTMDLIGASSYLWHTKHAVLHHTYVNIHGQDTDIDVGSFARLEPHQPLRRVHRWQHLYMWLLYGLMAARWHLWGDFQDVAKGKIGPHRTPRPKGWDLAVFVGGKLLSVALVLVIPMFWHPWWVVLLFYLLVTGIMGLLMAVVFQLAHCVEEADFPLPDEKTRRMEHTWSVHQVETTVDFARDSRLVCWLLGGLNFQVEHHLFPRICHVHYPALSRIVEQTCREYGVRYRVHKSLWAGVVSHYRWLRRLGRPEPEAAAAGGGV